MRVILIRVGQAKSETPSIVPFVVVPTDLYTGPKKRSKHLPASAVIFFSLLIKYLNELSCLLLRWVIAIPKINMKKRGTNVSN